MKIASLLAGAAALSLMAAPALAGPEIHKGATTRSLLGNQPNIINSLLGTSINYTGSTVTPSTLFNPNPVYSAVQSGNNLNPQIALFTIDSNGFNNDAGDLNPSAGAQFAMSGNVSTDCAYYTGGTNTDLSFGTIGINAQGNNPDAAFEMIGNGTSVAIDTNLAGCNTRNTVTISKTDLVNSTNVGGFDNSQFTNVIPVELVATFTAGGLGETGNGSLRTVSLTAPGTQQGGGTYGAWKSSLDIDLTLRNPGEGLLAGAYSGTVSVLINSQL